jgi:hypothetical protein
MAHGAARILMALSASACREPVEGQRRPAAHTGRLPDGRWPVAPALRHIAGKRHARDSVCFPAAGRDEFDQVVVVVAEVEAAAAAGPVDAAFDGDRRLGQPGEPGVEFIGRD